MSFFSLGATRSNVWSCKDCGQSIYQILNRNNPRFKHVANDKNGVGGLRGDDHVCPNRLRSGSAADEQWLKRKHMCHRCHLVFPGKFRDCPFCFKLICQNCSHEQDWLTDYPEDTSKNTCNKCGHKYLAWTEVSKLIPFRNGYTEQVVDNLGQDLERTAKNKYLIKTGEYVRKSKDELNWQRHVLKPEEIPKQIFDCDKYGHVLKPQEKRCRVCGVGVIRA